VKYVYLLRVGQGHYKVGVSSNVSSRVRALQNSNPKPISVVTTRLVDDAYRVEKDIHEFLANRHVGDGREWFELTPEEALDMAVIINKNLEIDMTQQITVRMILAQQTARQTELIEKLDLVIGRYMKLEQARLDAKATAKEPNTPERIDPQQAEAVLMERTKSTAAKHQRRYFSES
jgi:hypothetical protein